MLEQSEPLLYQFGDFSVDTRRRRLLRSGEAVPLTPKVFDTLLILIERRGETVTKEQLMHQLWPDSFVEEANIAQNVAVLRRALGEKPKENRFIATVPGQGYRFVADVACGPDQVEAESFTTAGNGAGLDIGIEGSSRQGDHRSGRLSEPSRRRFPYLIAAACFGILGIVILAAYSLTHAGRSEAPIFNRPLSIERLSTDGGVSNAVISPDGRESYYVRSLGGLCSIRVRDFQSGNDGEIIEGTRASCGGLNLSPDGKSLYFVRRSAELYFQNRPHEEGSSDLYRVSLPGGIPQVLAKGVEGWTAISPDDSKISFVRCPQAAEESCSLFMADALDGHNEQKLATRPAPIEIRGSAFSLDGDELVFANGQSQTAGEEFKLSKVNLTSKVESDLPVRKLFSIKAVARIPGSDQLLMSAIGAAGEKNSVWRVDASTGEAAAINKLDGRFNDISLDDTASVMVSTEISPDFKLHVYRLDKGAADSILAPGEWASFETDTKVVFASELSGQMDIWTGELDGRDMHRLTDVPFDERVAIASPDERYYYYSSNRSGDLQIWKMDRDGTNPIRLTKNIGGYPISVTTDGKWVFFGSDLDESLWRVPADGTAQEEVARSNVSHFAAVSPDGTMLAYPDKEGNETKITVARIDTGEATKGFVAGRPDGGVARLRWSADGGSIYYIQRTPVDGMAAIYQQPVSGGQPKQLREVDIGPAIASYSFAVSPDEKNAIIASGDWRRDLVLIRGLK